MLRLALFTLAVTVILAPGTYSSRHQFGACCKNRDVYTEFGETYDHYELLYNETKCACTAYRNRKNTTSEPWDSCPDCYFNGTYCQSDGNHMGGNQLDDYCSLCGSKESVGL